MKRAFIVCLAILSLLVFDNTAEAGRRRDRRAARKGGGGGIYAGASQGRSSGGYGGGYAGKSVAPVAYAEPIAAGAPDLTITEIAAVGDTLVFTVTNIGNMACPETKLNVMLAKPQATQFESENFRVLPLLPSQSVKIKIKSAPTAAVQTEALVDPNQLIAESNEENNDLRVKLAGADLASAPPTLADEATWTQATKY
jgi:hypothetical protein